MFLHFKYFFLLANILLLNSCSHYYYAPDEDNVLKMSEQHDLKIAVSGSTTNGSYRLKHSNFQLGYSPIKHLGLFTSHFKMDGNDPSRMNVRGGKGHLNNAAIGGYYFIATTGLLDKLVKYDQEIGVNSGFLFDAYAGYGKGNVQNFYIEGGQSYLDLQKYFMQGGLHWQGNAIGFSYVIKFGKLNYFNGSIEGKMDDSNILALQNIISNRSFPFRETSIKCYMGIQHIRFYANIATVVNEFDNAFPHRTTLGSLGIEIEIDEIFRSLKNNKG